MHRQMTERTVSTATIVAGQEVSLKIFFEGGDVNVMRDWLGGMDFERQIKGDLGEKMLDAFEKSFAAKARNIVMIGTDCPAITSDLLEEAFFKLKRHDLVIGPAEDGGYYLIGLSKRASFLFKDISWGSGKVFKQTKTKAVEYGLSMAILETLSDIDRPADLPMLEKQE